jgi:hypothetical protein
MGSTVQLSVRDALQPQSPFMLLNLTHLGDKVAHYSFVRLADGEPIPLVAANDAQSIALLEQRENVTLSMIGEGSPIYAFAKSDAHTFWCRPNILVYHR